MLDKIYNIDNEPPTKYGVNYTDPNGKKQGYWEYYNRVFDFENKTTNHTLSYSGYYRNDEKHGIWNKYFLSSGVIEERVTYVNDKKEGIKISYFGSGFKMRTMLYKNDSKNGRVLQYLNKNDDEPIILYYMKNQTRTGIELSSYGSGNRYKFYL